MPHGNCTHAKLPFDEKEQDRTAVEWALAPEANGDADHDARTV